MKKEIAIELGVTRAKVAEEIKRHGIARPKIFDHLASLHSRSDIEKMYIEEGIHQ